MLLNWLLKTSERNINYHNSRNWHMKEQDGVDENEDLCISGRIQLSRILLVICLNFFFISYHF